MSNTYRKIPNSISFNSIIEKDYTLSSSQYMDLIMPNKNFLYVKDFLKRGLQRKDLGVEVGSLNYIGQSTHYFIRTKALQAHSFLPEITNETTLPIMPNSFIEMNLKQGDLLISKDSNIGEVIILDKDYPNYMLSGAIYKLPVIKNKYYLLAFIKHNIFREQLDSMVPKGATIRHAKTMFLDCKIPMPNKDAENVIKFVEVLTQAIINKEKLIKERHKAILKAIETELLENQKPNQFSFELPRFNELEEVGRIDTARYSPDYKKYEHLIQNYKDGFFKLSQLGYTVNRGQNLQISNIGESFYSNSNINGFYKLAVSSNFSEYSTVEKFNYLGNPGSLKKIAKGEIIFSARGAQFGRVVVFPENIENTITNIDSLVIKNDVANIEQNIFIAMFLNNLRWNKHIYKIAITGSGANSLTQYQSDDINFPNFEEKKQKEIALLYHNANIEYKSETFTLANFLDKDNEYNQKAGIYELDKTAKLLKALLNDSIDNIVNDKDVTINFS
ncbi:restriction endonuclease subunit S [Chryseobacterium lathyri]|uniref:Type I restriction enzyme S subunit n=1 Tax=Chryseobacterium lathyri TaxID=395933 RepID=A0ABT9SLU6_9FLAO|nr:restriction endonuclease subunit S [Chryseobacterium lathyri]MDP9960410.1 type I restriction enzyme S subunit [Chryseobacterium lathyri]